MRSKRYKKLPEKTRDLKSETVGKLFPILKQNCTTKFDESLDLSLQINNKQKKNEINIRTVINLPGGSSKKVKVGVVCEENKSQEAKDAGAEVIGGDELIEEIKSGKINFEKDPKLPFVRVNETHMVNIFVNILDNAIKYNENQPDIIIKNRIL